MKLALLCTILAALLLLGGLNSRAESPNDTSVPERQNGVILVELFTSEGCSSCPPADALLRQINGTRAESGRLVVGISEHVTYWNQLGWSDPFSAAAFTERQNAYAERFRLNSVYTPQMVIDGQREMVGSDKSTLFETLRGHGAAPKVSVQINSAVVSQHDFELHFSVTGNLPASGADVYAVVAEDTTSNVLRGENAGRTLMHTAVARSITRVATLHGPAEKSVRIPIPPSSQGSSDQMRHLILFVQSAGYGRVLGADTKPL